MNAHHMNLTVFNFFLFASNVKTLHSSMHLQCFSFHPMECIIDFNYVFFSVTSPDDTVEQCTALFLAKSSWIPLASVNRFSSF